MLLDRVVVGNSIEALSYAFLQGCYFLPNSECIVPAFYEKMPIRILGSDRKDYTWSRMLMMMSLQGKVIACSNTKSVKITDEKISLIIDGRRHTYHFERCDIFDPTGVTLDNEILQANKETYKVYDDFEVSVLGSKHKYLEAKVSKDPLASEIYYYTSDRVDGANYVTDCLAVSYLDKDQLNNFEYSDSMVNFCVQRHLQKIGINGSFMKLYKNGSPKYRKPKVVHRNRVVQNIDNNKYKDSEKIRFISKKLRDLFK